MAGNEASNWVPAENGGGGWEVRAYAALPPKRFEVLLVCLDVSRPQPRRFLPLQYWMYAVRGGSHSFSEAGWMPIVKA